MWKWLNFNPLRILAPKLPLHPSGTFYAQSGATTDASRRTTCESPGPAAHLSGEKKRKKKKKLVLLILMEPVLSPIGAHP